MDALSGQAVGFHKAEQLLSYIAILLEPLDAALKLSNVATVFKRNPRRESSDASAGTMRAASLSKSSTSF